jgi:ATP-binding cassette, subfamily B, bacterial MsbA
MDFLKRLWEYSRPYKILFTLLLVWIALNIGLHMSYPLFAREIIDRVVVEKNVRLLHILSAALLGIFLLRSLVISLELITAQKLQQGVIFRFRNLIYYKLQQLSLSYFEKEQKGPIVSKVMSDVNACKQIITQGFSIVITAMIRLFGVMVILFFLNWKLTLVTMVPMPFIGFLIYNFSKKAHAGYRQARRKIAEVTSVLQENIYGIREIKTFTQENYEMDKFSQKGRNFFRINMLMAKLQATYFPLILFCSSCGIVLVLWYGGLQVIHGMSVGTLVAFTGYLTMLYQPIQQINQVNNIFQQARAAGERIFEILDMAPEVKNIPGAVKLEKPLEGNVVFKDVSFGYSEKRKVLDGVSFQVKAGESLAIVGPTGSGKTTIISLIPRFYDIDSGEISIDGKDLKSFRIFSLRSQIGMVLQEPFLFHGTIAENISFGKQRATREDIIEVAKAARAHDFIKELSDDYDTEVGEQGSQLSVGQKQRIAIARALLKDPPILILDEATSSVDTETERLIQEALERLMKGRTSFIIAHRLSTIRNASKIIVLKDGRIVERGTHKQLLEKGGLYFYLYQIQFGVKEMREELPILMRKEEEKRKNGAK